MIISPLSPRRKDNNYRYLILIHPFIHLFNFFSVFAYFLPLRDGSASELNGITTFELSERARALTSLSTRLAKFQTIIIMNICIYTYIYIYSLAPSFAFLYILSVHKKMPDLKARENEMDFEWRVRDRGP